MDQILVVFLNDWFQNCSRMAEKKLGLTHYFHGKNCLVVEMALYKSYQLSLGQDHCTDVDFLWELSHHQSVGHDIVHPQTSGECGTKRRLHGRHLLQKVLPQSSLEGAVLQAGVIRVAGCLLWPPSLALYSSFRQGLWLSLCPGSHTWNVYEDAAERRRGWCSLAHKKRIHEAWSASGNGCCLCAQAALTLLLFLSVWSWFGGSPEYPHSGYFSQKG